MATSVLFLHPTASEEQLGPAQIRSNFRKAQNGETPQLWV